jgi:hypothetical protein
MEHLVLIFPAIAAAGFVYAVATTVRVRVAAAADRRAAESTGQHFFSDFGEAFVGRVHLKRPFAHMTATPSALHLLFGWKRYEFPRMSIERLGPWNPLWGGVVIKHSIAGYPSRVVFVPRDIGAWARELRNVGYTFEADYLKD